MRNHVVSAAFVVAVFAAPVLWAGCAGGSDPDPAPCTPVTESCDGVDDDCDGETDEAGATGCTAFFEDADADGSGGASACLCAAAGSFTLTEGGDCDDSDSSIHPGAAEACDGVDDDCDAQTDEGIADCCAASATQPCGVAQGACAVGTSTCGATFAWGPCLDAGGTPVVLPGDVAETCNGLDDDCDGETDEPGTADCAAYWTDADADGFGTGSPVCACSPAASFTAAEPGDCDDFRATSHPGAAEACNGLDDDCDGQTDEGFGLGGACNSGTGACAVAGQTVCEPDGSAATCDATPGTPGTELCNGLDDDCDGQTDEDTADAGAPCDGEDADLCNEGTIACETAGLVCGDHSADSLELCNGVDDDCNGYTDEAVTDAWLGQACCGTGNVADDCTNTGSGTRCRTGAQTCSGGGAACVGAVAKAAEICDGVDGDCNGAIDDIPGLGNACTGGVVITTGACTAALTCNGVPGPGPYGLTCSQIVGPMAETCNGVDDDCDGSTDESLVAPSCALQAGVCAGAGATCGGASGWLACSTASYGPSYEATEYACDGLDNDCDGTTDEAPPPLCPNQMGVCAGSRQTCGGASGWQTCTAASYGASYEAAESLCDNLDNDCDGQTDEPGCL